MIFMEQIFKFFIVFGDVADYVQNLGHFANFAQHFGGGSGFKIASLAYIKFQSVMKSLLGYSNQD